MPEPRNADLIKDAQRLVSLLAREVGDQAAVRVVHSGAIVQHATAAGLIRQGGGIDDVAALHPALAPLAGVDTGPAADLWARHSVADPAERPDGYRLGDLYQHLSEEARKGRALCQTPRFVTELLLDISWEHAFRANGPHVRMIDPACGTGHILVETLVRTWVRQHLGVGRAADRALPWRTPSADRIAAALDAVHGVDLDPYAAAVAAYRLLAMAAAVLRASGVEPRPGLLPGLPVHVAAANSLLDDAPLLERGAYHVVVANPPYITVKDRAANAAIRARYPQVCAGTYSLALPFHVLMHELLVPGGWCAQLTANSFMKREFGRRYVEGWLAEQDLRWVIDTSGAYIPGHGTPTVILVTRNQPPSSDRVKAVMGVRGEPSAPADPARGVVWSDIVRLVRERETAAALADGLERAAPAPAAEVVPLPQRPVYRQETLWDLGELAAGG